MMTPLLAGCIAMLVEQRGSDVHLAAGNRPVFRVHGELVRLESHQAVLLPEEIEEAIRSLVSGEQFGRLLKTSELDAALSFEDGYRLRLNAYRQHDTLAAAIRLLPNRFLGIDELGLDPRIARRIGELSHGLVLVTGATGSGKSTTIASLVHEINKTRPCHIHTIEDPVEYRHESICGFVTQREIGRDCQGFAEALKRSMRQDPDVVVVGEMRDTETMSAALALAETGHLTFATLHTSDAVQTVSRIIGSFPAGRQPQVRIQLASTLRVVINQRLLPEAGGPGRVLAAETLVVTSAVRAMIREEKTHQIRAAMQTGSEHGMATLGQALSTLARSGRISRATAIAASEDGTTLAKELERP